MPVILELIALRRLRQKDHKPGLHNMTLSQKTKQNKQKIQQIKFNSIWKELYTMSKWNSTRYARMIEHSKIN
jgi:hypothetical protein